MRVLNLINLLQQFGSYQSVEVVELGEFVCNEIKVITKGFTDIGVREGALFSFRVIVSVSVLFKFLFPNGNWKLCLKILPNGSTLRYVILSVCFGWFVSF